MIFEIPMEKYNKANRLKKRDCYKYLEEYINNDSTNVCALYGLRRTGKSTMMFQAIKTIGIDNIGYILCEEGDNYGDLSQKLNEFISQKKKAVFIDEITKLNRFITSSASLADYYSGSGTKIVITGTDSLGLNLVKSGELHDRLDSIHTTYTSYGEFSRLINKIDIDDFIHYGGVLSHEKKEQDREFFDRKSASTYIDSAISSNITNTFFKDRLPSNYIHKYDKLIELHNLNMLIPVISEIVEIYNGVITASILNDYYKKGYLNADISSSVDLLSKHNIYIDDSIFTEDFAGQIAMAINARRFLDNPISEDMVTQIVDYLYDLELITPIQSITHNDSDRAARTGREYTYETSEYIYQAGMKYCQAKDVIDVIKKSNDTGLTPLQKEQLCEKLDDDVKGKIIEITITNDLQHYLSKEKYEVLKMKFTGSKDGEIDIVVSDKKEKLYYGFEVKHSSVIVEDQAKNLVYKPFQQVLGENYGEQKLLSVLYRGETKSFPVNGIFYINISDFLNSLYLSNNRNMEEIIKDCLTTNNLTSKENLVKGIRNNHL